MTAGFDRRSLLAGSLLGAGSLALPRLAFAQGTGSRNLLFVLLRGAADGMAMLAPVGDPGFEALRAATLADYENAPRIGSFFAVHPALAEIAKSAAAGEALFVHAAATAYRERSHFDGQNLLESGGTAPYTTKDGWLNRLAGLMNEGAPAPLRALAIAPAVPLALRGDAPVSNYAPSALPQASEDLLARVSLLYGADGELGPLWARALETRAMAADDGLTNLRDASAAGELAASLMRGEGGARIGMIELGGWDTHANQRGAFARSARQLDALLAAYKAGMGAGWANTVVVVATEFGRTARLNGTGGTDHGTASAALVMGGAVRGGRVIADWPGLADGKLYEGRDLAPTIALESVIAGAVAEHLRLDPKLAMARLFPGRGDAPLSGIIRA
ncbi:uncharacterized protein (DUF1501 family) [Erythromicrobium ramosum]|uniref:DUF1501 domain-containing protein n=1 Tax=Erythrobacter ramosus TaxID=35811 RepID=A0A6I4UKA7_9SPHN|nr:DUF1501 domain-containing protein [Erythrobacter ramosus]MBB3775619.1 uncharacterized protein (DUF1501 family) [Erythrobacter ramosus]MXP39282.1 DUF1501 domain-containing protein [Erythrobacter ramosus]